MHGGDVRGKVNLTWASTAFSRHGAISSIELKRLPNMRIHVSTKASEITQEGIRVETPNGTQNLEADTIIYAIGQKPLNLR